MYIYIHDFKIYTTLGPKLEFERKSTTQHFFQTPTAIPAWLATSPGHLLFVEEGV